MGTTAQSRLLHRPDHPLAPPSGTLAECRMVLYDAIGPGPHPCHWCGRAIDWMPGQGNHPAAIVVDHLDHDIHRNEPSNLVASCRVCNAHRTRNGDRRLITEDEAFVVNANGSRDRAVPRTCETCAAAFLVAAKEIRPGRGRYCSLSCARRGPSRQHRRVP